MVRKGGSEEGREGGEGGGGREGGEEGKEGVGGWKGGMVGWVGQGKGERTRRKSVEEEEELTQHRNPVTKLFSYMYV